MWAVFGGFFLWKFRSVVFLTFNLGVRASVGSKSAWGNQKTHLKMHVGAFTTRHYMILAHSTSKC